MDGQSFSKNPNSTSVINLVPPRELWGPIQKIRTKFVADARCGPHISFIDPFVTPEHFENAANLLRNALANFPPFTIKLNKFNYFVHGKSATLFLEPEFDPPNALDNLLKIIMSIFPQCDDQLKKSKDGKFKPHVSIAKFKNEKELLQFKSNYLKDWLPISYLCKELYILHRKGTDPFSLAQLVQFGGVSSPAHFGPTSNPADPRVRNTVVVCGLPASHLSDASMLELFEKQEGVPRPIQTEVTMNPDGTPRTCGVAEFLTEEDAQKAVAKWNHPTVYIKPLKEMFFPDISGGCCSLKSF